MTRRYPRGTRLLVTVRAAPTVSPGEARSFIDHIDGCQAGTTMTCRLTLENDTTITAHFRLPQLTVGVAGSGARVGSLTSLSPSSLACGAAGTRCSADVERGHVVELSASSVSADVIGFRQGDDDPAVQRSALHHQRASDGRHACLQLGAAVTIGLPRLGVTSSCGTTFTLAGDRRCVVTLP
ncbi:MAG: hypothetical protein Q8T13_01130 [Acidobacteriota bacterium]|nr:hypothetical protein [Acidobacteriota bacterium]